MAITRRETKDGSRFDVEWRLPDRSKRRKSFKTEREARVFEAAIVTKTAAGDIVDPRGGRVTLATVYKCWFASRLDLSPKVRRGYEDVRRLRVESRFGSWSVAKIDHASIQKWVNEMAEFGLSPRSLRWVHSVLRMCLDHAAEDGQLLGRNAAARTKFPPLRPATHTYLTAPEVAALTLACGPRGDVVSLLAYTGMRFGELTGFNVEDVDLKARRIPVRRSITQVGGKLVEGNPKTAAGGRSIPSHSDCPRSSPGRLKGRGPGEPAITSPLGSRLGLENWKRSVRWRHVILEVGRPTLRVHDLRHTYASLAATGGCRSAASPQTMGHASITVTAHIYADLYDDELDDVASALDALDDRNVDHV